MSTLTNAADRIREKQAEAAAYLGRHRSGRGSLTMAAARRRIVAERQVCPECRAKS